MSNPERSEPPAEGATLENIVRYVLKNTRMTEPRARHEVNEVLETGVSVGRIKKTAAGTYLLATAKPASLTRRIREPRFSDDSDEGSSSAETD